MPRSPKSSRYRFLNRQLQTPDRAAAGGITTRRKYRSRGAGLRHAVWSCNAPYRTARDIGRPRSSCITADVSRAATGSVGRPHGWLAVVGGSAFGASRPLPSVPTKVRLLNRLPTLDLGGGNYSSCPINRPCRWEGKPVQLAGFPSFKPAAMEQGPGAS